MSTDQNGIIKNGFFTIIQIILSTLSYVLIYYLILSTTGKKELGIWSIITSVPAALTVFGSGVSGCLLRHIPIYSARNENNKLNGIVISGALFNIILAAILILNGYLFSEGILKLIFSAEDIPRLYFDIFHITLITFFFNFISSVFLFALDGLQLIYKRNIIMMVASMVFCVCAAIFIPQWGLKGLLYAQVIQSVIILTISIIILWSTKLFHFKNLIPGKEYFRLFFGYGQGFQYISISIILFDPLTKYFLNLYFNLSIVGVYDIVNRAITQIRIVLVNAIQVIVPVVSKQFEEKSLDIANLYTKATRGAALLSILSYSLLICISIPLVLILDKKDVSFYIIFLVCLSAAYLINIIATPAYSILMGLGKLKSIIVSHILSTGINIVFFIFLQYKPLPEWMAVPPLLAISVSSIYILNRFHCEFKAIKFMPLSVDLIAYVFSICTVVFSIMFYYLGLPAIYLYTLSLIYIIFTICFIFNNPFLKDIRKRLRTTITNGA